MLENSSVKGFPVPLIWLYGSANLTHIDISANSAKSVILTSGKAVLNLVSVFASHLTETLVDSRVIEFPQASFTVLVSNSKFEDNANRPVFDLYDFPGTLHLQSSSFARNLGLALFSNGIGRRVLMQSCILETITTLRASF